MNHHLRLRLVYNMHFHITCLLQVELHVCSRDTCVICTVEPQNNILGSSDPLSEVESTEVSLYYIPIVQYVYVLTVEVASLVALLVVKGHLCCQ